MPVWYERARRWSKEQEDLQVVGLIQEQHPARCALFLQWQQMDFPILVDTLNRTRVAAVPLVWAIDEHGVVRKTRPDPEWIENSFLGRDFAPPAGEPAAAEDAPAERLFLAGDLDASVATFRKAVAADAEAARAWFGLGCALRARFDRSLAAGEPRVEDFRAAVRAWTRALELAPGNYIWRRRIQQFGPRLDKPYPFYDWVESARKGVRERGGTPVRLPVEPRGAELAAPARAFHPAEPVAGASGEERLPRDDARLVHAAAVVVPDPVQPGTAARVILYFTPDPGRKVHWTNDAGPLRYHVQAALEADRRLLVAPPPPGVESSAETRSVEFEIRVPKDAAPGVLVFPGFADYYVCKGTDGECLYLRQDLPVEVQIAR